MASERFVDRGTLTRQQRKSLSGAIPLLNAESVAQLSDKQLSRYGALIKIGIFCLSVLSTKTLRPLMSMCMCVCIYICICRELVVRCVFECLFVCLYLCVLNRILSDDF